MTSMVARAFNTSIRHRKPLTVIALSAATLTVLASFAPATQAAPATDNVEPYAAGTCWDATYAQAKKPTYQGSNVDCTEPHTIEIASTLEVPDDVAAAGPNSRDVHLWVDARCQVEVNNYAGVADPKTAAAGTRTWYFWFTPTAAQWKSGDHWVACAAGSVPKSVSTMRTKPRLLPVSNSIADSPGRNRSMTFVTDSYGKGTLISRKPMTSMAGKPYPGSAGLQKKAWKFCEKTIGSNKYFWYGPSELEWRQGWTAITCFSTKKR